MDRVRHLLLAACATGLVFAGAAAAEGPPQTPPGQKSDSPGANEILRYVETMLCVKEAKSLGSAAFLAKYGQKDPLRACRAAQQAAAQAIVNAATTSCTGDPNPIMCVKRAIVTAVGHPTGTRARP